MKIIVITRPDFFEGETEQVNQKFEQGMQHLHLRKPKATKQEMAEWIERIALPFRHCIVVHDHHSLAKEYSLGGIHLNSRNPELPAWFAEERLSRPITVSRSCHSLDEIKAYKQQGDYLFLSPIFDSISKEGYGAAFSREELAEARSQGILENNVYALGGICPENLQEVEQLGFSGAAMLGAAWR